nr:cation-chloride cotransporter 1-like isoform X2 [Physcomitrium patens]|eukprot:XP_024365910.1 cation-chloride cotransporter 1-like isoform X2 [Physcomitrella patens]
MVDVRGLKSMGGQQNAMPHSPRDPEDYSMDDAGPSDNPGYVSLFIETQIGKMGTLMGVFVPCFQNIMGIIFYIRFTWIIGIAGVWNSLLLVCFCCFCTFLTAISLSAIATNGAMKGGGPYYLIGRALGPEVGVSIGLCFFLGNAVAGAMYILGAVETFLDAIPAADIFRRTTTDLYVAPSPSAVPEVLQSPSIHDLQVYGLIFTAVLCVIVFGGVKIINRVSPAFLMPVILSLFCIFIGIFTAGRHSDSTGITGLKASTLRENLGSRYQYTNDAGIPARTGYYWDFESLLGLFFPAVTGIMAGSNRSGSLKDTQRSIPRGTLSAIAATATIYLVSIIMFGAVATRNELLTDRLLTATIAWPVPWVVQIAIVLSTLGAALQSLTGAPRLLAAIANDDIIPVLKYFKAPDDEEPYYATIFTIFICAGCVVLGNLDLISPVTTMFFLLCYGGVNLSCFLLDLLDAPSWRPRFKFHHWSLSLLGAIICITIMFMISFVFTIVALALAALLYWYVSIKGKGGDWGDGFKSAYFQLALRSLRSLGATPVHPKNWYPIPLIFCKPWGILPSDVPCHPKLADFANCMKKKGRGMSIFASIVEGDYEEEAEESRVACQLLSTYIDHKKCEGVAEVVVAPNIVEGFRLIVQAMGLANLKPNIVCMRYPEIWREQRGSNIPENFVSIINDCSLSNKAVVIVKGLDEWPGEFQKHYGTIDLYWIVRDGGLMLLLSQLLRAKDCFESCKIQVFCIAEKDSEAVELKTDVKKFLYDLRMQADVIVVTMKSWEDHREDAQVAEIPGRDEAMENFSKARKRIAQQTLESLKRTGSSSNNPSESAVPAVDEQQVNKFLYTCLKLNSIIMRYSGPAAVVLVSLPPPPQHHPAYCYMEYIDLLVANIPRMLMVRGYSRDVVTIFT